MKVELSERAHQRIQELVEEGEYPSTEAALDAAVERLCSADREFTPAELSAFLADAYDDVRTGRVHAADAVLAEATAKLASRPSQSLS